MSSLKKQLNEKFPDLMRKAAKCRFDREDCHGPLKITSWNGQTFQACAACRSWLNRLRVSMMPSPEV